MTLLPVAVHTLTGHKVAMKFISKHVINMTRTKNRVQREVEYMRTLRHAHIIKLSVHLAIASFLYLTNTLLPAMKLYLHRPISSSSSNMQVGSFSTS